MNIREEQMAPFFTKFHLEGPWPFPAVIHRFTEPDRGDAHDHPWAFRSIILAGGYAEHVFNIRTGGWVYHRREFGDSFRNEATTIHRIVELLAPEVWTLILPEAHERTPGFYQFREDGAYHRFWHEPEFTQLDPAAPFRQEAA